MIPENRLSTVPLRAAFLSPDGGRTSVLKDKEYGGIALRDPTRGLFYQKWDFAAVGNTVVISAPNHPSGVLFIHDSAIKEISATFDQNMNPCVAFVDAAGIPWLYWFDTALNNQVQTRLDTTLGLGEGVISPRVCLDDKRLLQTGRSDIILSYIKNNTLYTRRQRDRFGVAFVMAYRVPAKIMDVGMNRSNRLQWKLKYEGIARQELPAPVDPGQDPGPQDPGTPNIPPPPGGGGGPIIPPPVIPPPYYPPAPPDPPTVPLDTNLLAGLDVSGWSTGSVPPSSPSPSIMTEPVPGTFVWEVDAGTDPSNVIGFIPGGMLFTYTQPGAPLPMETVTFRAKIKLEVLSVAPGAPYHGATTRLWVGRYDDAVTREFSTGTTHEEVLEVVKAFKQGMNSNDRQSVGASIIAVADYCKVKISVSELEFIVHRDPMPAMSVVPFDSSAGNWTVDYGAAGLSIGNNTATVTDYMGGGYASVARFHNNHDFGGVPVDTFIRVDCIIDATRPWSVFTNPGSYPYVRQTTPERRGGTSALGNNIPVSFWMRVTNAASPIFIGAELRTALACQSTVKSFTVQRTDAPVNLPVVY